MRFKPLAKKAVRSGLRVKCRHRAGWWVVANVTEDRNFARIERRGVSEFAPLARLRVPA